MNKPTFVIVQKKKSLIISARCLKSIFDFAFLKLTFWSTLILFCEIFSDMQALKRFSPRAAGGAVAMLDSAVSVSDSLHASAGSETPITSKCLVGGKYFHGASKSHLVCRRFHIGSARLGSAWN